MLVWGNKRRLVRDRRVTRVLCIAEWSGAVPEQRWEQDQPAGLGRDSERRRIDNADIEVAFAKLAPPCKRTFPKPTSPAHASGHGDAVRQVHPAMRMRMAGVVAAAGQSQ